MCSTTTALLIRVTIIISFWQRFGFPDLLGEFAPLLERDPAGLISGDVDEPKDITLVNGRNSRFKPIWISTIEIDRKPS